MRFGSTVSTRAPAIVRVVGRPATSTLFPSALCSTSATSLATKSTTCIRAARRDVRDDRDTRVEEATRDTERRVRQAARGVDLHDDGGGALGLGAADEAVDVLRGDGVDDALDLPQQYGALLRAR